MKERLSLSKLIPLSLTSFIAIMTETMPVGMLAQISRSLHISNAYAGQMLTVYAAGSFLSAIPVIALTRHLNRKLILILALAGFCLTNLAITVTPSFNIILIERFLAGVAASVAWGLLPGYTVRVSPSHLEGRALAIIGMGQPIALAIGVPITSYFVTFFAWSSMFAIISLIAAMLIVWTAISLPSIEGEAKKDQPSLFSILSKFPIIILLVALWLFITAHNITYTYISSYLTSLNLGYRLDAYLFIFGVSAIAGIVLTSIYVDRYLNKMTGIAIVLFLLSAVMLLLFNNPVIIGLSIIIWGVAFGGAPTFLMTYLTNRAGKYLDIAQSGFVTVFNAAISSGALIGGVFMSFWDARMITMGPIILTVLLLFIFIRYLKPNVSRS